MNKKCIFADPAYQAVMFEVELNQNKSEKTLVLGFIYSYMVEEFNQPELFPMKRLMMCNVAINNKTGEVIKNAYKERHP